MTFKMVTNSEKAAGRIAATALAHAELLAGEQTAKWRDRLPEEQGVVDAEQVQRFHAEDLLRLREALREKEAVHLDLLEEIREVRERRDAAAPGLRTVLYAMRDLFKAIYGDQGPRALFLGKPVVPVDATPLRRVGRRVVENLLDPDLELPEATLKKGTRLTMSELADEIKEPLEEMDAAMQELEDLLPLASKTLEAKREAHAAVDEKSAKLARFLEGLYELEGHDVLAARVRPSSHRRKSETQESAGAAEGPEEAQVDGARKAEPAAPEPATEASRETTGALGGSEPRVAPRVPAHGHLPWTAVESTQIQTDQTSSPPAASVQSGRSHTISDSEEPTSRKTTEAGTRSGRESTTRSQDAGLRALRPGDSERHEGSDRSR